MGKKRKTLPKEMKELLESGNIGLLKEQFLRCEPNAEGICLLGQRTGRRCEF